MGVHYGTMRREWRRLFPDFCCISTGPTHVHKATCTLSELDRFNCSLSRASVERLAPYGHIIGKIELPPAACDHWPIGLRWNKHAVTGGMSRWVAKLPSWSARIAERVMALDDPTQVWSKRWVHLRSMIEDESTAFLDELQWFCPKTEVEQLLFYKRLLMLLEGGHLTQATQRRRRAPAFKLPAEITTLKVDVAARLGRVESELLAEEFGDSDLPDQVEQTQAHTNGASAC